MSPTRRDLVSATASLGVAAIAGCTGSAGDPTSQANGSSQASTAAVDSVQASFFVFYDAVSAVAGDDQSVGLLVPFGQHGHGWSPDASVRQDIRDADLLVHGPETFQPWIDDILVDLENTATLDITADIDLLHADGGHDHDETANEHTRIDPHFWTDPVRMSTAVDTVQQRLADLDPDNAATYRDNAQAQQEQLQQLDEELQTIAEQASHEMLLVAGHNAFRYMADQYGFRVHALTNVSPDDRPTPQAIEEANTVIQEHNLDYVCADPIESQFGAQQLVEDTQAASILDLTAMPGLTDTWQANDWGYVEIMRNVNIPTLKKALDA